MKFEKQVSFKNISELKFNAVFLYTMIFAAVICPGLLSIYVYSNDMFIDLEVTKLVLLAAAIGAPLFGWSLFLATLLLVFDCNLSRLYFSENQVYDILLMASFQTFIITNLALAISRLLEWDSNTYFNAIFGASMVMALVVVSSILHSKIYCAKLKNTKGSEDPMEPQKKDPNKS